MANLVRAIRPREQGFFTSCNGGWGSASRWLHGPAVDEILAREEIGAPSIPVEWAYTDHLGSVRDVVANNFVTYHMDFNAFGGLQGGSNAWYYGFTGREYDHNTGLNYHRHRWLDSWIGRWINEDPIGFAGGDANLNRYVDNEVTTFGDANGLQKQKRPPTLFEQWGGEVKGPTRDELVRKPGPGTEDPHRARKFGLGIERNVYADLPNLAACTGDAAITGLRFVPGGNSGVELGMLLAGQGSVKEFGKALALDLLYVDEAQKLLRAGMGNPAIGVANVPLQVVLHQHHPLPRFLGGDKIQALSRLDPAIHREFHSQLIWELRKAGIPLNVGGRGGSYRDWANYLNQNPGAQRTAFDSVFNACRAIDKKHGTSITQDVWTNVINSSFYATPMSTTQTYVGLHTLTMDPCSLTKSCYEQARSTWLCTGCCVPKPKVHELDVILQAPPTDKPINIVQGCGLSVAYKPFLDRFPHEVICRDLYVGRAVGPEGKPFEDWVTFRGKNRLIVRGNKHAGFRQCDQCGRDVYFAMGTKYLHPRPSSSVTIFESSGGGGIIVEEEFLSKIDLGRWRTLDIQVLPVLDEPIDGLGQLSNA